MRVSGERRGKRHNHNYTVGSDNQETVVKYPVVKMLVV